MSSEAGTRRGVIAHRGTHGPGLIENTLAAFEAALVAGAGMIELDVRRTSAGEMVILHDHRLRGVILRDVTLDEFEQETGFRPPLLKDVLDWAGGRIGLDVELKEDGYVAELVPLLRTFVESGSDLIVTSFLEPVLAQLSQLAPELRTGLLLTLFATQAAERARSCGAAIVLPEMKLVTEALLQELTEAELEIIVWDFMAARDAALLGDERVTAVITDDVPGALAAR